MMYLDSLILAKHSRQAAKTENPLINLIKLGRYVHYIAGQPSIYGAEFWKATNLRVQIQKKENGFSSVNMPSVM